MRITRRQLRGLINEELHDLIPFEDVGQKCYEIMMTVVMDQGDTPPPIPISEMDPTNPLARCFSSRGDALAVIESIVSDPGWDQNSPVRFSLGECTCPGSEKQA